jgi:sugar lactone lactonase YvrE
MCLAVSLSLSAQSFRINTIAGFGTFGGDGGPATSALLVPAAVVVDGNGDVYVSDYGNFRIRRIQSSGTISTLIGKGYGTFSGDDGPAASATMSTAFSLALDAAGNLYFTDDGNQRIREVTTGGTVRTIAGNGTCGTPTAGMAATQAPLCDVESVSVDAQGRVYFGSEGQVWMVGANGTLSLIAGNGGFGSTGDNGPAESAEIGYPGSMAIDAAGDVYLADQYNFKIREVTPDHIIHAVATISDTSATTLSLAIDSSGAIFYVTGRQQAFKIVSGTSVGVATLTGVATADYIAVDHAGALYISSITDQRVLKISGGGTAVIAGAYPYDVDPLPNQATSVRLHLNPLLIGLAVDSAGNVYFPELDGDLHQRIDKVTPGGTMSALAAPAKLPTGGDFTVQAVVVSPSGQIYFSTFNQVYRLDSGSVTLIAGAPGFPSNVGDGGPATAARISNPSSLAFDRDGNLYITEPFDSRVRRVTPQGTITTFAGTGHAGYSGDGGLASSALLSTPVDVKTDANGNVYIADLTASVVRKVAPNGVISTIAGTGTKGDAGDGGPATAATLSGAAAIAIDPSGNLFIADRPSAASTISPATDNNRIRMVNTSGVISTIAGPVRGYNGEGVLSTAAALGGPVALAADAQGNIYVNESDTQRIRKLTPASAGGGKRRACCK